MGVNDPHGLGRNTRLSAVAESVPFTYQRPVSASAMRVLKATFTRTEESKVRADARQTRSELATIRGKVASTFAVETYAMGSGVAGTPPDAHELWRNHFGVYTNVPGTSDTYAPTDSQNARGTISMVRENNELLSQAIRGGAVDVLKLVISGGDEPKVTFEGNAADVVGTGTSTLDGAVLAGDDEITVQSAEQNNFRIGSVIRIGTSTNGVGSPPGYLVVDKDGSVLTIDPPILTGQGQADGADVLPYIPTETVSGSPIAGILGDLTLDGTSVPITGANLEHRNNDKFFTDEAFRQYATDYVPGFAIGMVEFTLRARRDQIILLNQIESGIETVHPTVVTCGDTAGSRVTITMPRLQIYKTELDVPQEEEAIIKVIGRMLGNTGGDHISVRFD